MREIKFRAWDKENEFMVYTSDSECLLQYSNGEWYLSCEGGTGHKLVNGEDVEESSWETINEFEVMQFTGLKDKNGKEIYEGDIVKATEFVEKPKNRIIRYDEPKGAYFMISNSETETQWNDCLTKDHIETFGYEVIGNIYENPELLSPSTKSIKQNN